MPFALSGCGSVPAMQMARAAYQASFKEAMPLFLSLFRGVGPVVPSLPAAPRVTPFFPPAPVDSPSLNWNLSPQSFPDDLDGALDKLASSVGEDRVNLRFPSLVSNIKSWFSDIQRGLSDSDDAFLLSLPPPLAQAELARRPVNAELNVFEQSPLPGRPAPAAVLPFNFLRVPPKHAQSKAAEDRKSVV